MRKFIDIVKFTTLVLTALSVDYLYKYYYLKFTNTNMTCLRSIS